MYRYHLQLHSEYILQLNTRDESVLERCWKVIYTEPFPLPDNTSIIAENKEFWSDEVEQLGECPCSEAVTFDILSRLCDILQCSLRFDLAQLLIKQW